MAKNTDLDIARTRERRRVLRKILEIGEEVYRDVPNGKYSMYSEYYWGIPLERFKAQLKAEGIKFHNDQDI